MTWLTRTLCIILAIDGQWVCEFTTRELVVFLNPYTCLPIAVNAQLPCHQSYTLTNRDNREVLIDATQAYICVRCLSSFGTAVDDIRFNYGGSQQTLMEGDTVGTYHLSHQGVLHIASPASVVRAGATPLEITCFKISYFDFYTATINFFNNGECYSF